MKTFEFNSAICTSRQQSKRLLALGIKKETADMYYRFYDENTYEINPTWETIWEDRNDYKEIIPAWSLHRLIEMIPKQVKTPKPTYGWVGEDLTFRMNDDLYIQYEDWGIENEEYRFCGKGFYNSNLYDNIIECIEWLTKEGYFNKEYLEEKE